MNLSELNTLIDAAQAKADALIAKLDAMEAKMKVAE
jgi:hypothetical protein